MANDVGRQDPSELRRQRHESRSGTTYKAFLRDVCARGSMTEQEAEAAAVAVLCRLEQRLMAEEANDLEAQLPFTLRNLLQRCEKHVGEKPRKYGRDEFVDMVARDLDCPKPQAELACLAVFEATRKRLTDGEAMDVEAQLPADLKDFWYPPV